MWTSLLDHVFSEHFSPYAYIFPSPVRLWFWGMEGLIQLLYSGEQGLISQEQENKASSGHFCAAKLEPS